MSPKQNPDADITLMPGLYETYYWNMDMSVTEKELGYRSQWSVKEGTKETINMERRRHGLPSV